jgi:uroporphyrinogen decarboxylase
MNFGQPDRALLWEFGFWAGAVRRWYAEGLPKRVGLGDDWADGDGVRGEGGPWSAERALDFDVHDYFGFDKHMIRIPLDNAFYPRFEPKVLEDHGDWILTQDGQGIVRQERKDRSTVPQYIAGPVRNRDDWERIKAERLRPTLEGRLPGNWPQLVAEYKVRDYPLCIGGLLAGFFGTPRQLLGPETLLLTFYDDPEMLQDMISYLADFWIAIYDKVLDQTDADLALIWEDMSYKAGSMISPAMFRRFMLPAYQKMTSFLRDRGVKVIIVDTDGDCWELIPLFLEGGVTGLYPFEVNAGMNVVEVRKAFPKLQILGGIDKVKIAAGPPAIDEELEAKVPFMLRTGGYVPYADHNVPPDVSWQNFVHYRRRLEAMIRKAASG